MRLFVDLDLERSIISPGVTSDANSFEFKRSLAAQVEVQFCRNGLVVELASDATGIFEFKPAGRYDQDPVAGALSWVKTGAGATTVYTFLFSFINAALDALFFVDGNPANDVAQLLAMAELQWTVGGNTAKTQTLAVKIDNDVVRDGDTLPGVPPASYGINDLLFGIGTDGTLILTQTTAAPSYATKTGSGATTTFNLIRNVYANDLTLDDVNGNFLVNVNGFQIFVKGTFLIDAGVTVHANGGAAVSNTVGTVAPTGTIGGSGQVPGAGLVGAGAGAPATAAVFSISTTSTSAVASGGIGGAASGGGIGGGAGVGGTILCAAAAGNPNNILLALNMHSLLGATFIRFVGGGSGGGGDSTASSTSGGGGAGGGVVSINARILVNHGAIQAKGGNGGNASGSGTGAGGGGGGGGGAIVLIYISTGSTVGTTSVIGGNGGTLQGAGAAGAAGVAGLVWPLAL